MALATASPSTQETGPRVGVAPDDADLSGYLTAAKATGLTPYTWQRQAASAIYARDGDHWRYPEVAILTARQNGKTTLLLPTIVDGLARGLRQLHTAHNRDLPRETFMQLLALAPTIFPDQIVRRRSANGQEEIALRNGGSYRIVSDRQGGGRGKTVDRVFVDELREQESFDLVAALTPTMTVSPDPQIVWLSNAGHHKSVILNDLRERADNDPSLCYLEWSADPDYETADRNGWAEANPRLTSQPEMWDYLERQFRSRPVEVFETEHLCRWVTSLEPSVVTDFDWQRCFSKTPLSPPLRPVMGISMDPSGSRASAVIAWLQPDGSIALRVQEEAVGQPIDVDQLGPVWWQMALKLKVAKVSFDPWTDTDLARYFPTAKPLTSREYANASENFARTIESQRLRWEGADAITKDLPWISRKAHDSGSWQAVRVKDDQPVTACLAAVRAVWLASAPKLSAPQVF